MANFEVIHLVKFALTVSFFLVVFPVSSFCFLRHLTKPKFKYLIFLMEQALAPYVRFYHTQNKES